MSLVTGGCVVSHWGVCRGGVSSVKRGVSIDGAYIYIYLREKALNPLLRDFHFHHYFPDLSLFFHLPLLLNNGPVGL